LPRPHRAREDAIEIIDYHLQRNRIGKQSHGKFRNTAKQKRMRAASGLLLVSAQRPDTNHGPNAR
jgi:hypothetical protein